MLGRHVIGWTPGASSIPATIMEAAESARRLRARLFRQTGVTTAGLQADEAAFRQKYSTKCSSSTVPAPLGRPVPGCQAARHTQYRRLSGRAVRPVICKSGLCLPVAVAVAVAACLDARCPSHPATHTTTAASLATPATPSPRPAQQPPYRPKCQRMCVCCVLCVLCVPPSRASSAAKTVS